MMNSRLFTVRIGLVMASVAVLLLVTTNRAMAQVCGCRGSFVFTQASRLDTGYGRDAARSYLMPDLRSRYDGPDFDSHAPLSAMYGYSHYGSFPSGMPVPGLYGGEYYTVPHIRWTPHFGWLRHGFWRAH